MKIIFYAWNIDKQDFDLIKRIKESLEKLIKETLDSEILEIASYGEILHDPEKWGISFGSTRGIIDTKGMVTELPDISCLSNKKENKNFREGAYESLTLLAKAMKTPISKEKKLKENIYIETSKGITIGKQNTDIILDEQTIDYINKIKKLVGGKAYIEKNNIKVEIL